MTPAVPAPGAVVAVNTAWRRHGAVLAAVAAALVALFARDAAQTVATWWTSTTFGHCFVVAFLIGWLVWQRRALLAGLTPAGWAPGLIVVVAGGGVWLVGEAAAVTFARELGLLIMLEGAVVTLLGPRVARGLAFPLGYAFFLVPFGEWLEAPLQAVTVRLAMPLLAALGIPATADGVMIHAGRYWFEVAEACSGAKFVIAMVAMGVLACHLCFSRWSRRIAFMVACVVVPVLANGLRVAITMWVADRTSVEMAGGFDHIVYGWVWFGVVVAATLAIGWRWFDRPVDAAPFDPALLAGPVGRRLPLAPAALSTLVIAAGFVGWGAAAATRATPLPDRIALPSVPGWHRVSSQGGVPWRPVYPGADRLLTGRYADATGRTVDVAVAIYGAQGPGRSLIAYGTGALGQGPWLRVADLSPIAGASAMRIAAPGPVERVVTTRYVVAGTATSRAVVVKLATLRAQLFGGSQLAMAVHLSALAGPGRDPADAIGRWSAASAQEPAVAAP
jgi:exosortase A